MVLNTQPINTESLFKAKQSWQWEKKHWLLVISVACLALWWFGSNLLEVSLVKKVVELLPLIGGMAFATEAIIKLSQ